jgi:hypothetical protein
LTTARELSLFEPGPIETKRITAEVCAHHLWFDDAQYARMGTRIKCNPAIKSAADRRGLIAAVNDGRIDVIATDHAPHTAEEKARRYFEAPSGLPLVQHVLNMLIDQYRQGLFSLETIVRKTAHNPAILFGIKDRGFIREQHFADLAIVDLGATTFVDEQQIRYKCGWSPFEGHEFGSQVAMTILGGQVVYDLGLVRGGATGAELVFTGANKGVRVSDDPDQLPRPTECHGAGHFDADGSWGEGICRFGDATDFVLQSFKSEQGADTGVWEILRTGGSYAGLTGSGTYRSTRGLGGTTVSVWEGETSMAE